MPRPALSPGEHGEPWTRQLDDGRWIAGVRVRGPGGRLHRVERCRATGPAARAAVLAAAREVGTGPMGTGDLNGRTKFRDAGRMWLAEREAAGVAPTTLDHYRDRLRCLDPVIGELRLGQFTTGRVRSALDVLAVGRSASTLRALRSAISGVMKMAVERDAILSSPAHVGVSGRGVAKMPRALDRAERVLLLDELAQNGDAPAYVLPLVRFMLATGVRVGEALAMRWSDLDLDARPPRARVTGSIVRVRGHGLLRAKGKTAAARRTLMLPSHIANELRERGKPADPGHPLFAQPGEPGEWLNPGRVSGDLRRALDRAGFEWVTSHVFRKTAATILDEQGLPVRAIADHLGHASPSLTQDRYFGRQQTTDVVAEALDRAWGG